MASFPFEKSTIASTYVARSRSSEDEDRIERFLHLINRSEMNIRRSMMIIEGINAVSDYRS